MKELDKEEMERLLEGAYAEICRQAEERHLELKIEDWYGIHDGYKLTLDAGYTAIIGPNGAGKTTLLRQIEEELKNKEDWVVHSWSNYADGGAMAKSRYVFNGQMDMISLTAMSSEGEQIYYNFGDNIAKLGATIKQAADAGKKVMVLFDALDSGTSIDKQREIRDTIDFILEHTFGAKVWIVVSCNSYELVAGADCVDPRTGTHHMFTGGDDAYGLYADYICEYDARRKEEKDE